MLPKRHIGSIAISWLSSFFSDAVHEMAAVILRLFLITIGAIALLFENTFPSVLRPTVRIYLELSWKYLLLKRIT
jgi:hypothetical protein